MEFVVKLCKTIGNPTRVRIVAALLREPGLTAEDLAIRLKIPRATACRNLRILERMDFVAGHRNNVNVYYSVNHDRRLTYNQTLIGMIKQRMPTR